MAAYLVLLACFMSAVLVNCKDINIKIVDAPHTNRHSSSSMNSRKLVLRGPPAPISGPPHMRAIIGECFETRHRNYLYSICPFHNVTQKEESNMWNRFHGVLGVWREWVIEDDRFVGMLYAFGEKCGKTNREAKIMFKCSTITKLTNITEPKTCKYTIWMWTPLACFKGAMQVYRVLTSEQIMKWEELDTEYHSDILTKQGLLKKRRQLLLAAGLYYNFTKDEEYDRAKDNHNVYNFHSNSQQGTSSSCQSQLDKIEKELKQVKSELNNYRKALSLNPSLKLQLDQLLLTIINSSNSTAKPAISNITKPSSPNDHKSVEKSLNQRINKPTFNNNQPVNKPVDNKYGGKEEQEPIQPVDLPTAQPVDNRPLNQVVNNRPLDILVDVPVDRPNDQKIGQQQQMDLK